MNKVMVEYGLEPYDENVVRNQIETRAAPLCSTIESLGNFNGDSNLNTLDLVLNLIYVKNNGDVTDTPPCDGGYIADVLTSSPDHPDNVEDFAAISWAYDIDANVGITRSDCYDEELLRDYLLGVYCDF